MKSFSVQKACTFILIFFAFLGNVLGQDPATQVPDYDWLDDENLPTVEIKLSSLSVNTEDITIAIATDPQNFIYNLTFGSGIQKRNPDGSIVNANYISGLSSPLDFAIDDNGYFYVADYSENTTCSENGKIRIFKPDGSLDRVIYTGFYRPLGIDVDSDGNIYVAEYNAPGSGCENNELSRVSIYNSAGTRISRNETVLRPYRIAVNSNKTVYLSQEGNGNPEVIILDQNLNITGNLPNIQSPGSVVVDSFDFIHVVEYAGRIDFSKFINFENLSFGEIQDIAEEIDKGTDDNAFGIKVFDPQNNFEYNHKQEIDFPIDISFNLCDKMYVDNAEVFGGNVIFVGYVPRKIEFDLEIYERTPAYDLIDPIAQCVADFDLPLVNGSASISVEDINNGATDNCGIESITLSQTTFTEAKVYDVVMTVTDNAGNKDTCTVKVTVTGEEVPLTITDCDTSTVNVSFDSNCEYELEDYRDDFTTSDPEASIMQDPLPGTTISGDQLITLTPVLGGEEGVACKFIISPRDTTKPVITNCPTDITATFHRDLGYEIPDYSESFPATDNCDADLEVIQSPSAGTIVNGDRTVNLTYQDDSGNSVTCTFLLDLTETSDIDINCNSRISLQADDQCRFFVPDLSDEVAIYPSNAEVSQSIEQGTEIFEDTQVVMTATSVDGERSNTCTINLVLVDYIYPEVTSCIESFEIILPPGGSFEVPDYRDQITATDNCEIVRTTQRPEPGTFITEDTQVRVDFYDAFENYDFCSFNIRVLEDEDALPFNCKSSISFLLEENGERIITPAELLNVTGDISDYDFELSRNTFDCDDVTGQIPVEINYTGPVDGSCTVMVDINDVEAPYFIETCQDILVNVASGVDETTVEFELPIAEDNCSVTVEQTQGPVSGSLFSIGETQITFTAKDAAGNSSSCRFKVIVTQDINQSPAGTSDNYSTPENTTLDISVENGVLSNDQDPNGDELTASLAENVENGSLDFNADGSFSYTPDANFFGFDSFIYTVSDGIAESEEILVTIEVVEVEGENLPPVAEDDAYDALVNAPLSVSAPGILDNDLNSEGEELTATLIEGPSFGTLQLNGDGSFEYIPDTDFVGTDSFIYSAKNSQGEDQATVTISVLDNTSGRPLAKDDNYTTNQDEELIVEAPGVLQNDIDPNQDEHDLRVSLQRETSNGTISLFPNGKFIYTPNPGFYGTDIFVYTASEFNNLGSSNFATVTITVLQPETVNTPPEAIDDSYSTNVDVPLSIAAPGILINDTDAENNPLSVQLSNNVSNGELILNSDGSFVYTPDTGFIGEDSFTYVAFDGQEESEEATVTINVNDPGDFECVERLLIELEDGEATLNIEELYNGNASGIEFGATERIFSCEDIGQNLITLVYTGRIEGSCDIIVEVVDNSAPVLQVKDISRNLNEDGIATINFEDIDNGSYDKCDPDITYTLSKSVFSCKELGTNLVQVQAEDSSGNISSDTVTVIITDDFDTCEAPPLEGSEYIFIYPNPNTGSFKVATPADVSIQRLEVFDHRGRFIAAKDYDASVSEYAIELGPLQEAVYVVKIITNKETLNKRFIFKY